MGSLSQGKLNPVELSKDITLIHAILQLLLAAHTAPSPHELLVQALHKLLCQISTKLLSFGETSLFKVPGKFKLLTPLSLLESRDLYISTLASTLFISPPHSAKRSSVRQQQILWCSQSEPVRWDLPTVASVWSAQDATNKTDLAKTLKKGG